MHCISLEEGESLILCSVLTHLFISHAQRFLVFLESWNSICQAAPTNSTKLKPEVIIWDWIFYHIESSILKRKEQQPFCTISNFYRSSRNDFQSGHVSKQEHFIFKIRVENIQLETTISNGQLLCSIRFHRSHHHLWPNLPHFHIEAPSYSISMQCPLNPHPAYKVSSVNNYCSSLTFKHQLKKYMKIKPRTWG